MSKITKQQVNDALRDTLTHLENASTVTPDNSFIILAKETLALATQGVIDLIPPASNGLADVPVDPEAPLAVPLANPTNDTSETIPTAPDEAPVSAADDLLDDDDPEGPVSSDDQTS